MAKEGKSEDKSTNLEKENAYKKIDVVVQTAPAMENTKTKAVTTDVFELLVEILNKVDRIEKEVC